MKRFLAFLLLLIAVALGAYAADQVFLDGEYSDRFGVTEWVERGKETVDPWAERARDSVTGLVNRLTGKEADEAEAPEAAAPAGPIVVSGLSTPESAVYDPEYDRYLVGNVGAFGPDNDGSIASVTPDGEVDLDFIRGSDDAPLANALGTAVHGGHLYVADSPFVRVYDLATRTQVASHEVPGAGLLNDLAVANDGTVYVTDMGGEEPDSWAVITIALDGTVSDFARGADLQRPNGVEVDQDGRVVLAAVAAPMLVILTPDGLVEQTITLPAGGYDGVVVLDDGYVVSNPFGNVVYRVGLDGSSEQIGGEIASPASLGYDPERRRLLIPQLQANTVTLLDLD